MVKYVSMKPVESLAERAAEIFVDPPGETYSVPINYPEPEPRFHLPFDVAEAAYEAMVEDDIYVGDLSNLRILRQVVLATKKALPNWKETSQRRKLQAGLMNRFYENGPLSCN